MQQTFYFASMQGKKIFASISSKKQFLPTDKTHGSVLQTSVRIKRKAQLQYGVPIGYK